jgi:hypothetical protein
MTVTETNLDAVARLAPGTLVAGRCRIVALVGAGGMGDVYKAHDEELKVDIALEGEYDDAAVCWKEALALREAVGDRGGVIAARR